MCPFLLSGKNMKFYIPEGMTLYDLRYFHISNLIAQKNFNFGYDMKAFFYEDISQNGEETLNPNGSYMIKKFSQII